MGYGPPVLHAADAGVVAGVHAVSLSPFGGVCYGAAGLALAAGILPQAAAALLPMLGAAVRAAKRAMRRAPPMAPWLMVSMMLFVIGKAHGAPHGGTSGSPCGGVPLREVPSGGILVAYAAADANVSTAYVGVPVALATVLWTVDTASEVMVVGRAAYWYAVARVLDHETDRAIVTPSGAVVVADAVVAIEVVVGGVTVVLDDVLLVDNDRALAAAQHEVRLAELALGDDVLADEELLDAHLAHDLTQPHSSIPHRETVSTTTQPPHSSAKG